MNTSLARWLVFWLLFGFAAAPWAQQTALDRYVARPDPNYAFVPYATDRELLADTYLITLNSQQWRNPGEVDRVLWQHDLAITVPTLLNPASPRTAFLLIDGGGNRGDRPTEANEAAVAVAVATGSIVAWVRQVPNQPLSFSDEVNRPRVEDEILAYSMDKFLATGDETWPVHLAMTKAAVRAMDTVQTFLASKDLPRVDDFVVLGGSKRGWTTWLTAAVDPRVRAILPASIDMLNLGEQFRHHWEAYGFYTRAIGEYAEFDLPCQVESSPRGQALLDIIDPYSYRARYTIPTFIANSTGDQFFLPDSSRFYYDDLFQPRLLRYTPNTDHAQNVNVILSATAWLDDIKQGNVSPRYSWTFTDDGAIRVQAITRPSRVRLWQATNPLARDFRLEAIGAAWRDSTLQDQGNGVYVGFVPAPARGWSAFLVELTFEEGGVKPDQVYTTAVRVTPDTLPFAGTACSGRPPRNATASLYAPAQASYLLRKANAPGPADTTVLYGVPDAGWTPVVGDWNGDGFDTIGLYRPDTARFLVRNDNAPGFAEVAVQYGSPGTGWTPVVGDWNGDGVDTVGLYDPARAIFHLRNSNTAGTADVAFEYGPPGAGWIPVVGDWNGDGVDTVGLYDPRAARFYLRNSNTPGVASTAFEYGPPGAGWIPVVGDWNGDGVATVGLYDPRAARFYLRNSNTAGFAEVGFNYGAPGNRDVPVVGRWK